MLSDAKLLLQLQAGDEASFEALFLRHYERIYGVLIRLLGDRPEAEDLAQDVFLKLYNSPQRIRVCGDETNVIGWLYRVAVNEGYNALRRQKRRTAWLARLSHLWPPESATGDPDQALERLEAQSRVRQVLADLKPREAKLLLLRQTGLSYKELAAVLNVAPGSVGSLLTRAERAFRERYGQVFPEGM